MESKKFIWAEILKTAEKARVMNCVEEEEGSGEFYYLLWIKGKPGLVMLHESQIRIL